MKKEIIKEIQNVDLWHFDGVPRDSAISEINSIFDYAESKGFKDCVIRVGGDVDFAELIIYGKILETDKEYQKRLATDEKIKFIEEKSKKKQIERDMKLLASLKKKYENK